MWTVTPPRRTSRPAPYGCCSTRGPCHFEKGWLAASSGPGADATGPGSRASRCSHSDLAWKWKELYTLHVEDLLVHRGFLEEGCCARTRNIAAQLRLESAYQGLVRRQLALVSQTQEDQSSDGLSRPCAEDGRRPALLGCRDAATFKEALTNQKRRRLYDAGEYLPINDIAMIGRGRSCWPRSSTSRNEKGDALLMSTFSNCGALDSQFETGSFTV